MNFSLYLATRSWVDISHSCSTRCKPRDSTPHLCQMGRDPSLRHTNLSCPSQPFSSSCLLQQDNLCSRLQQHSSKCVVHRIPILLCQCSLLWISRRGTCTLRLVFWKGGVRVLTFLNTSIRKQKQLVAAPYPQLTITIQKEGTRTVTVQWKTNSVSFLLLLVWILWTLYWSMHVWHLMLQIPLLSMN